MSCLGRFTVVCLVILVLCFEGCFCYVVCCLILALLEFNFESGCVFVCLLFGFLSLGMFGCFTVVWEP